MVGVSVGDRRGEPLRLAAGVVVYSPTAGHQWRVRWVEDGRRRDTSTGSSKQALELADALADRLSAGIPTEHARACGLALVEHFLNPGRCPARGRAWSERHREEMDAYCRRFVLPVIARVPVKDLGRRHLQRILDQAPTPAVAANLRRCLSALVNAGLEEGVLLVRQDVLRGVRVRTQAGYQTQESSLFDRGEIPTPDAVHRLARAAAARTGVWWRELQILLVAYSGLRWGEQAALTADHVDARRRRITVDCQVLETRHALYLSAPKNRRRRTTMFPARTPQGVDLTSLVERRLSELEPEDLMFPSPRGLRARRSNYRRNIFEPAATAAGWSRHGQGHWTFHSLRHVFATWALAQPGARIGDVSRLLGHASVRVTLDVYVNPDGDLFDRFFEATR